ncbi:2-hydroxyacid dehydrogenase [Allorhizobium pseudoryzae]|uniref:2-hydroxyacid dehydrogenase n=1 Tax=Allorhizobium pseudoryzae TaxID=379684 RepID=UPI003D07C778
MNKPHILQLGTLPEADERALDASFIVHRAGDAADRLSIAKDAAPEVRAIVTRGDIGVERHILELCPQLEIISIFGVGFDRVDTSYCRDHGIRVTNTPGVLNDDVADIGIAMMLCQARDLPGAQSWVKEGRWRNEGPYRLTRRVSGKKAGILGLGRIGIEVAKRLKGFGMDVFYSDLREKADTGDLKYVADPVELARRVDFMFVTLSASAATKHIVGKAVLKALGPEGTLINISRASNVDEDALLQALESGSLGYAALDVFEGEPAINERFLRMDNVLVQPHHASGTSETRKDMGRLMRQNLTAHFAGEPLDNLVGM